MMLGMLVRIALPAFLGSLVNDRTHGWGKGVLSPALAPACRLMMLVVIAANSTAVSAYMRHLTPELVGVILCIATLAASGYALGLVVARLLRRDRADAVTICFGCGMRNISSGAVIAGQYFADQVMFPVLMGTLFQQVLAALFGKVVDRMMGGAR